MAISIVLWSGMFTTVILNTYGFVEHCSCSDHPPDQTLLLIDIPIGRMLKSCGENLSMLASPNNTSLLPGLKYTITFTSWCIYSYPWNLDYKGSWNHDHCPTNKTTQVKSCTNTLAQGKFKNYNLDVLLKTSDNFQVIVMFSNISKLCKKYIGANHRLRYLASRRHEPTGHWMAFY